MGNNGKQLPTSTGYIAGFLNPQHLKTPHFRCLFLGPQAPTIDAENGMATGSFSFRPTCGMQRIRSMWSSCAEALAWVDVEKQIVGRNSIHQDFVYLFFWGDDWRLKKKTQSHLLRPAAFAGVMIASVFQNLPGFTDFLRPLSLKDSFFWGSAKQKLRVRNGGSYPEICKGLI